MAATFNHDFMQSKGRKMPTMDSRGNYKVQVTLSKEQYDLLRRKAYEMDLTVNRALVALALGKEK